MYAERMSERRYHHFCVFAVRPDEPSSALTRCTANMRWGYIGLMNSFGRRCVFQTADSCVWARARAYVYLPLCSASKYSRWKWVWSKRKRKRWRMGESNMWELSTVFWHAVDVMRSRRWQWRQWRRWRWRLTTFIVSRQCQTYGWMRCGDGDDK